MKHDSQHPSSRPASEHRPAHRFAKRPIHKGEPNPPTDLHLSILNVIRAIPKGRLCTYGRIAHAVGAPGRARLVGRILRDSPLADDVPWHRVVNAAGKISDRSGDGASEQCERLMAEGVEILLPGRVDLAIYLWCPA